MDQKIIIQYKTRVDYCQCCDQELPEAKVSEVREFDFSKENIMSRYNWKEISEFESDLQEIIETHVYETIDWFAVSSHEKILIENSELDKIKGFILEEIKK